MFLVAHGFAVERAHIVTTGAFLAEPAHLLHLQEIADPPALPGVMVAELLPSIDVARLAAEAQIGVDLQEIPGS